MQPRKTDSSTDEPIRVGKDGGTIRAGTRRPDDRFQRTCQLPLRTSCCGRLLLPDLRGTTLHKECCTHCVEKVDSQDGTGNRQETQNTPQRQWRRMVQHSSRRLANSRGFQVAKERPGDQCPKRTGGESNQISPRKDALDADWSSLPQRVVAVRNHSSSTRDEPHPVSHQNHSPRGLLWNHRAQAGPAAASLRMPGMGSCSTEGPARQVRS